MSPVATRRPYCLYLRHCQYTLQLPSCWYDSAAALVCHTMVPSFVDECYVLVSVIFSKTGKYTCMVHFSSMLLLLFGFQFMPSCCRYFSLGTCAGSLPAELGSLVNVEKLILSSNNFSGNSGDIDRRRGPLLLTTADRDRGEEDRASRRPVWCGHRILNQFASRQRVKRVGADAPAEPESTYRYRICRWDKTSDRRPSA